jgi:hypothetical protein
MNSLGAIAARLTNLTEPDDQVTLLVSYLNALEPADRESAARILAAPPRARRLRLSVLRNLTREQTGDRLFALSQDFVGDAAETIALLWQPKPGANRPPTPADITQGLGELGPTALLPAFQAWLDACDADARHLLVRLATGSFKPPANRQVLLQAFAASGVDYQPPVIEVRNTDRQSDLFTPEAASTAGTMRAILLYVHKPASRTAPLMCTFGVWHEGSFLPVGKASADDHKDAISRHASAHALKRFGPTTQVEHSDKAALLLDVSFDGMSASRRHKAGLTLQAPRITAISASHALDDVSSLADLTTRLPHA